MKGNLRKILIGVVIIIVLAFIFMRGDQLRDLIRTVQEGTPLFMVLAIVLQLGKYFLQGAQYVWCFKSVQSSIRYLDGGKLVFGTFFVNTIAPSLNLAGTTLVVDDSAKRGVPAGQATGAALLMQLSIDSGFVIIMLIAFGILSVTIGLEPGWLLLGLVAIALVGGLVTVMVLGGTRPELVLKVLMPIQRLIERIMIKLKRTPPKPWAENTIMQFSRAAALMVKRPSITLRCFLIAIAVSTCEMACFCMVGMSFGVFNVQALFCGYVVATLFAMVSFTPQGVGVVEAAVVVAFTLFGIDQAASMAIIMVYRGIVFWLPFLTGAILIQRTRAFSGGKHTSTSPEQDVSEHLAESQAEQSEKEADPEKVKRMNSISHVEKD